MKVELIRKEDWDGVWFHIYVDGICQKSFRDNCEAEYEYYDIAGRARKPAVVTVLKSEEV